MSVLYSKKELSEMKKWVCLSNTSIDLYSEITSEIINEMPEEEVDINEINDREGLESIFFFVNVEDSIFEFTLDRFYIDKSKEGVLGFEFYGSDDNGNSMKVTADYLSLSNVFSSDVLLELLYRLIIRNNHEKE